MLNSLAEAILNTHIGKNNQHGDIKLNNILYSPWEKRHSETIEGFTVILLRIDFRDMKL